MFDLQFGGYRLTRLPTGVTPAGGIFERKIYEISKGLPNVFSTANDIIIVEYNAGTADRHLRQLM